VSTSEDQNPPSDDGGSEDVRSPAERADGGAIVSGVDTPDRSPAAAPAPVIDPLFAGQEPTAEESAADKPAPEGSAPQAPAVDESAPDETTIEEPAVGGAAVDESATDELTTEEPAPGESTVEEPSAGEPAPGESGTEKPAPGGSGTEEPAPGESGTEEPAPGESGTEKPAVDGDAAGADTPTPAGAEGDATPGPTPSANPLTSMLGSVNEARSWLLELPDFEGPLDLLLHLVRRHELDILDIPISFVTEKYLEYLAFMQALDLEVAGDYLVMAATLAYLKSRELVPTEPTEVSDEGQSDDEGPDPREELIARLLEYQKYRAAASDLDGLPIQGRDVFSRGGRIELPPVDPGLAPLTLFRLAEAYNRVLDRARIHKSHDVVLETVSVAQRMNQLTSMLIEQERVEFEGLFLGRSWNSESELRSMLVVTLMSVLELTKLGVIFVHQDTANGAIVIERKATPEEAKQAIADYDENISFGKAKPGVAEASASGEAAPSSDDPPAPDTPEAEAEAEPEPDV